MQKYLEELEALHLAQMKAGGFIAFGRTVRRESVVMKYLLIRTHPLRGETLFSPTLVSNFWKRMSIISMRLRSKTGLGQEGLSTTFRAVFYPYCCFGPGTWTSKFI